MTNYEKIEKHNALTAELLKLQSVMRESDAHAVKCQKLNLNFAKTYPDEFKQYEQAREEYNKVEQELIELEKIEVEEEVRIPFESE